MVHDYGYFHIMLRLSNLQKHYHGRPILNIASLILDKGIYWLRGPNGSGKTTLLKIIAGIIPFDGKVVYRDIDLKRQPQRYRQLVGWSEAEPLFPEFVSGEELIGLYAGIRQASKDEVNELLTLFDMNSYIADPIRNYSSGMQKKLGVVLALIGRPSLIILDEPLITLDHESVNVLLKLMNDWQNNYAIDFLLSSHVEASYGQTILHREIHLLEYSTVYEK